MVSGDTQESVYKSLSNNASMCIDGRTKTKIDEICHWPNEMGYHTDLSHTTLVPIISRKPYHPTYMRLSDFAMHDIQPHAGAAGRTPQEKEIFMLFSCRYSGCTMKGCIVLRHSRYTVGLCYFGHRHSSAGQLLMQCAFYDGRAEIRWRSHATTDHGYGTMQ